MHKAFWFLAAAVAQITATGVYAQSPTAADKAAARAERHAAGVEAARDFEPGEGNPIPEPRAKVSKSDRKAARQARKPEGAEAAREFQPGEGDPVPDAHAKASKSDRIAARQARKVEGAEAVREFQPGEGDPMPVAKPNASKSQRAARKADMQPAQKAGEMPAVSNGPN